MDRRFDEVVINGRSSKIDGERGYMALCADCGMYHETSLSEYKRSVLVGTDVLRYVAQMRAWNCCHEGERPLDGFPEPPEEWLLRRS